MALADRPQVFLHQIEYYPGIIFFTTNLLSTVDEAFQSRMNIRLNFPKQDLQSRLKIWELCLSRSNTHGKAVPTEPEEALSPSIPEKQVDSVEVNLSQKDLRIVATWELNGREIENVVKTARLWCSYRGLTLNVDRLEAAVRATAPLAQREVQEDEDLVRQGKRPRLALSSV